MFTSLCGGTFTTDFALLKYSTPYRCRSVLSWSFMTKLASRHSMGGQALCWFEQYMSCKASGLGWNGNMTVSALFALAVTIGLNKRLPTVETQVMWSSVCFAYSCLDLSAKNWVLHSIDGPVRQLWQPFQLLGYSRLGMRQCCQICMVILPMFHCGISFNKEPLWNKRKFVV